MGTRLRERRRFELVLESRLQKRAFLDLPRHSRDREEGLDGHVYRDYDRDSIYIGLDTYMYMSLYIYI